MSSEKRSSKGMFVFICILTFIVSFGVGIASKFVIRPSWAKKYSVQMTDEIGKVYKDISYGDGDANKFESKNPCQRW